MSVESLRIITSPPNLVMSPPEEVTPQSDRVTSSSHGATAVEIGIQQNSDVNDGMGKWHHVEACLPDDCEGKYYADHYRCKPLPIFILSVTLLELGFFVYYSAVAAATPLAPGLPSLTLVTPDMPSLTRTTPHLPSMNHVTSDLPSVTRVTPDLPSMTHVTPDLPSAARVTPDLPAVVRVSSMGAVPLDSALLYRPDRHWQLWRLVTYMVLHTSWWHLTFNLLVQLVVGLPLEMVHGSARVGAIYLAGVLAGSLGTSVCDAGRQVYLVGASGGVYALLTAHIANVLLNYNYMELGVQRLLAVLLIAGCDASLALYHRYALVLPSVEPAISYAAHLAGGVAGLSLGLLVLRRFSPKQSQPLVRWLALGVLIACTLFAVLFNVLSEDVGDLYV